MTDSTKPINLSAFVISSIDKKKDATDLLLDFSSKLAAVFHAEERAMSLHKKNSEQDYDLCCTFEKNVIDNHATLFGTMIRYRRAKEVGEVTKELLSQQKFGLQDIIDKKNEGKDYKHINEYYFLIRDQFVVCNLKGNTKIGVFETYINWLLKSENYQLDPIIVAPPDTKLSDLEAITFGSSSASSTRDVASQGWTVKIKNMAKDMVYSLLKDSVDAKDLELQNLIEAKLLLKFKKPKNMTEEDYQKKFGAIIKTVNDGDDISFTNKDGKKIKGSEIEWSKVENIRIDEEGNIEEPHLREVMGRIVKEFMHETHS